MRKPIIFCLLISLFLACSATYAKPVKSKKEKTILNTTTIFILDGGRDYNKALEAVVPETWHVTPYKFMSVEEAQQYLDNDKFSFVARVTFERIGNLTPDEFECLAAFGALKSFQKIKSDQVVQREDLDLDHEKDVITTLPNSIERLNYLCIHGELYAGSKVKDMEARAGEVKTKTLYILKSQMGKNPEKFKQKAQKVYP